MKFSYEALLEWIGLSLVLIVCVCVYICCVYSLFNLKNFRLPVSALFKTIWLTLSLIRYYQCFIPLLNVFRLQLSVMHIKFIF